MNTAATIASHRSMEEIEDSTTIALSRPKSLRTRLTDAIDERRSVRRFGGPPSTQMLSTWLQLGVGLGIREQAFQG